ncbi:S8 family serine peptidase [Thiorhodococcus mannitoliphagus]|uniref:S8 family serine peptidase n=1 Tax=Thiorhodococcus mannitoliphagus TaxID=329406 RepID=A0A6P1DWY0_9GAMM|nr:S8 family serine peptidase [Thiorhodococcus mannitoliphagus]NEX22189.1 S8 family serine peptidase [Thiorhodococcus mannitoliphagus]
MAGNAIAAPGKSKSREGRILVEPKAGLSTTEFDDILRGQGAHSVGRLRNLKVHEVEVPPQAEEAVAKALSHNPNIAFAEPDALVEPADVIPNDPKFSSAWHFPTIAAPAAWEDSQAAGILIAVLDTGVDSTHPDLADKLLPGWNAVDGSSDTADINGHGTAVAGTAAASTNNATGVASVAWAARLLPVRVTNSSDGYAYFSDIARALTWAADEGARVANISFGVSGSSTITSAANYMRSKGGVVVVAAGNDGTNSTLSDNPAMISVSATTSADVKASWSTYGNFVDVAAPGASILTTNRGGGYGSWNGTSFASPVTAGVVALIMAANPELTPDQVEAILEQSADDIGGTDWDIYYGDGRVNAAAAVSLALVTDSIDEIAPQVTLSDPSGGEPLSGQMVLQVEATDNIGVTEVVLLINGAEVASDASAPYEFSWDTTATPDGVVKVTAEAYDAAGNLGADSLTVEVANTVAEPDVTAPVVRFQSPTDGATVEKRVNVSVVASDDDAVASLKLYIDGRLVSVSSSDSISYNWNLRKVADGDHTLSALATDASGNEGQSSIAVSIGGASESEASNPGRGNK